MHHICLAAVVWRYLYLNPFWCQCGKMLRKECGNFFRTLIGYQSHGNFCIGLASNYGFGTFARIASPYAIDI